MPRASSLRKTAPWADSASAAIASYRAAALAITASRRRAARPNLPACLRNSTKSASAAFAARVCASNTPAITLRAHLRADTSCAPITHLLLTRARRVARGDAREFIFRSNLQFQQSHRIVTNTILITIPYHFPYGFYFHQLTHLLHRHATGR